VLPHFFLIFIFLGVLLVNLPGLDVCTIMDHATNDVFRVYGLCANNRKIKDDSDASVVPIRHDRREHPTTIVDWHLALAYLGGESARLFFWLFWCSGALLVEPR
jgi:hypothetical protein